MITIINKIENYSLIELLNNKNKNNYIKQTKEELNKKIAFDDFNDYDNYVYDYDY